MDERYKQAKLLFLAACDLETTEQAAFLDRECGGDGDLRAEVESLLGHHEAPTGTFAESPGGPQSAQRDSAPRHIGPYRVVREHGRGGMGVVYLGLREDDQFKQRVAIKVLKRGMDTDEILRRFEMERRLLAAMDHPGIGRLYNGGKTDDGLPYFAMEYVEGQPINEYCDTHRLRIDERLELFRSVCLAVHHAHQNLVVHRDLKPRNIIVTRDGAPKLLDFGIAKVINPELALVAGDPTAPELRIMTPEYASPEQARGDPITTASDIYSLGVLLYELVTGHRPYRLHSHVRQEIERVICEVDPEKPSTAISRVEEIEPDEEAAGGTTTITPEMVSRVREGRPDRLRKRLAGDIDNIVLMAMRKEPQRRYASAEQFAEDIRRHLEGLTVIARDDTAAYRCLKFIRRHRAGVASAAAFAVVLGVASVVSASGWKAEADARAEAVTERDRATAERDRAERMFGEVLDLAHTFIFDLPATIEDLDGALPARELLVETALDCLDGLSRDVGDDPQLKRELASAYDEVGGIRGGIRNPSRGDLPEAMKCYNTALGLWQELVVSEPEDLDLKFRLSISRMHVGDALKRSGNLRAALAAYQDQLAIDEELAEADPRYRRIKSFALKNLGDVHYAMGDLFGARGFHERVLVLRRTLHVERPDDPRAWRDLSVALIRMGEVFTAAGDYEGALAMYEDSIVFRRKAADADPDSGRFQRDLAVAHQFAADVLLELGRTGEASPHIEHFMDVAERRARDNPTSARARGDLAWAHALTGRSRASMNDPKGAWESYSVSHDMITELSDAHPSNTVYGRWLAESHESLAEAMELQGNLVGAARAYQQALSVADDLVEADPDDWRPKEARARMLSSLGKLALETGDPSGAQSDLERARELYVSLRLAFPEHAVIREGLAEALHGLSVAAGRRGDAVRAAELAQEALAQLEGLAPRPRIDALLRAIEESLE